MRVADKRGRNGRRVKDVNRMNVKNRVLWYRKPSNGRGSLSSCPQESRHPYIVTGLSV